MAIHGRHEGRRKPMAGPPRRCLGWCGGSFRPRTSDDHFCQPCRQEKNRREQALSRTALLPVPMYGEDD